MPTCVMRRSFVLHLPVVFTDQSYSLPGESINSFGIELRVVFYVYIPPAVGSESILTCR